MSDLDRKLKARSVDGSPDGDHRSTRKKRSDSLAAGPEDLPPYSPLPAGEGEGEGRRLSPLPAGEGEGEGPSQASARLLPHPKPSPAGRGGIGADAKGGPRSQTPAAHGYRRPDWQHRAFDGWITGGRSVARYRERAAPPADTPAQADGAGQGSAPYAELHCHTNYSFKEGASEAWDLLTTARDLGLKALAITDHDNVCGAMEFAQSAKTLGVKAIIGVELTLTTGLQGGNGPGPGADKALNHHITLLAENPAGYRNICLLVTRAHMDAAARSRPELNASLLPAHSAGVVCLSGCRRSQIGELLMSGDYEGARDIASQYAGWFGKSNFYLELQQNLVRGDTPRNRLLARLARELGVGVVATNNVHYHTRERHRLNDALVAIQHNKTLEETHRERRPNDQSYLKAPGDMAALFAEYPDAIANTAAIADRCQLDLTKDRIYQFPDYPAPPGHTPISWLRKICEDGAVKKYGGVTEAVRERLDREFRLLEKHNLAGFLLQYHDIIKVAHQVQLDLGIVDPDTRLGDQPPGRGRGSSVALLAGYLIGLSHIDPLKHNLRLERFLSEEINGPPDIDLDFPRAIREELILRVHKVWGPERAVLTGMISTYKIRGVIRDLGKAFGLPEEDLARLIKLIDGHAGIGNLAAEMTSLPEYRDRVDAPLWKDLLDLALQLNHFPKYLAQHPGGMVLSNRPLSETVPVQRSAIDGRYICQWDKNSAEDAGFVKIDFLALGALSQMTEALELIRQRTEERIDLSRINFEDQAVYGDIHAADTIGVFQIESAAQMQTVVRLKPKNIEEMAWEVGAVRPGVGVNDGVSMLIRRHLRLEPVTYDHPREIPALERTLGVPLYQDQLGELAVHVAGMSPADGDRMRRSFSRRDSERQVPLWHDKFIAGALRNGVPIEAAEKVFKKFHGLYQFPEAHAFAFGVTAYQMAWLKHYYPLEFFVGLFNNQPMGFYNLETLKEDAKRHGINALNPDANLSGKLAVIEDGKLRLGLAHVAHVRDATADAVLAARRAGGPFSTLADFMERTRLQRNALDSLAEAGAFDRFDTRRDAEADRREVRWEAGLRYRPVGTQLGFHMPVEQDMAALPAQSGWDRMMGEYRTMGLHPAGHIMARIRPGLPQHVISSNQLQGCKEGERVTVAGLVIRRQRPSGKATFITLEDEFGHSPLIFWPAVYERVRLKTVSPLLVATGRVSRREGTLNVVVENVSPLSVEAPALKTKDWG